MSTVKPCPECGGTEIYRRRWVDSGTIRGVKLLQGLGGAGYYATFEVRVCRTCGLTRLYASEEARQNLEATAEWTRLEVEAD